MSKLTVKVSYDYDRDLEIAVRVQEDVVDALNEAIFNVLNQAMERTIKTAQTKDNQ